MTSVHCPKCGSDVLHEKNVAYAELEVYDWDVDADGYPSPADYDTDVSADWECADVANQYVCRRCRWEGGVDDLRIEPATPPSAEQSRP